jgi:hypothetical protein
VEQPDFVSFLEFHGTGQVVIAGIHSVGCHVQVLTGTIMDVSQFTRLMMSLVIDCCLLGRALNKLQCRYTSLLNMLLADVVPVVSLVDTLWASKKVGSFSSHYFWCPEITFWCLSIGFTYPPHHWIVVKRGHPCLAYPQALKHHA